MTIVECEICETKFISEKFGSFNACDTCECGNLQLIVIPPGPPTKLRSFLTVRYDVTYPKIYETLEEKISIEEEPIKKLGFN